MTDQLFKLEDTFNLARSLGGWPQYAVHCMGDADTGDDDLDFALAELYSANENLHRVANKLALRHGLDMVDG